MDPATIVAVVMGAISLVSIVAHAFMALRTNTQPKAITPMISLPDGLTSLEAVAANPIVQAVLINLLRAIDAGLEAKTTDPNLRQLESVAFGLVVAKLQSLAPPAAVIPGPTLAK